MSITYEKRNWYSYIQQLFTQFMSSWDNVITGYSDIPILLMRRASGSESSPSAVQSGDIIAKIATRSYAVADWATTSKTEIIAKATENHTNAAQGTRLEISTTPNGSTTCVTSACFDESGDVALGGGIGSESVRVNKIASVANRIELSGSAAGQPSVVEVIGSDSDVALRISPKGSEYLILDGVRRESSKAVVSTGVLTSVTLTARRTYLTGSAGANLTVTFPAASANIDGALYTVFSSNLRLNLTLSSSGATFVGTPATLVALTPYTFQYDHATTKWYLTQ